MLACTHSKIRNIGRGFILATLITTLAACGTANKLPDESTVDPTTGLAAEPASDQDVVAATEPETKDTALNTTPLGSLQTGITNELVKAEQEPEIEPLNVTLTTWRAERGHLESQVTLGMAYAHGKEGVKKDPDQAKLWLELASMKGHSEAQYELGKLFYTGSGADKDYFNAREWWLESAAQGNIDAQQMMGYLYSEGLGVEQDFGKAKTWYLKAAREGHAEAQTLLGSLYHEGNRIPHDYSEAFKWYKLAAEQGHAHAQYTLAKLYHDGLGTMIDFIQCAAWVDVATANGFEDIHKAREACRSQLDDLGNRTATHLANTWKKRYPSPGV